MLENALRRTVLVAIFTGCAPVGPTGPMLPWEPGVVPVVTEPLDNPSSPSKIELGRLLFHDPLLSSDRAVACVTCHGQIWGLSDGLPVSVGIDGVGPAGTGRTGPNHTRRNSSTLWNAAFRETLFWDGRARTLEDQVLFPIRDTHEMNRTPEAVVDDLRAIPDYVSRFQQAFPLENNPVTVSNLQRAIASFERTLISLRSPYDLYVAGDTNAVSPEQREGMNVFGERGCPSCHTAPLFESSRFERSLVTSVLGVEDHGRREVTGLPDDEGRFRVPTLRNIRDTAPYFHNGTVATLEEAVALEAGRRTDLPVLTEAQRDLIVVFLRKTLVDVRNEPVRPMDVPSGLPVPLDGYRVPR